MPARRNEAGVPPTPTQMGKGDDGMVADGQKEFEFFREERIVVFEFQAEERERVDERTAAGDDFSAAIGDEIERGVFLKDADGVGGAEHGDGAREADILGARGGCGEDDGWSGIEKFGAMMLANAKDIEADLVCERDFLEHVLHAFERRKGDAGDGVGDGDGEAVDSYFHGTSRIM